MAECNKEFQSAVTVEKLLTSRMYGHEIRKILPSALELVRQLEDFFDGHPTDRRLGLNRAVLRLQRHLAIDHQHLHNDHHLPDGVPHPEHTESR